MTTNSPAIAQSTHETKFSVCPTTPSFYHRGGVGVFTINPERVNSVLLIPNSA